MSSNEKKQINKKNKKKEKKSEKKDINEFDNNNIS